MTIKRYEHGGNFLKERERESKSEREGGRRINEPNSGSSRSRIGDGIQRNIVVGDAMG